MEPYEDLPPVRIDEYSHDPIVLDAGTVVGIASGGLAAGKLFPAHVHTGAAGAIKLWHHSDGATWGLATSTQTLTVNQLTGGPVKPLGMVFQPIYSFKLQATHHNYTRNVNVGVVTNYMVQIPARNAQERAIVAGDRVMVNTAAYDYGHNVTASLPTLGTLQKFEAYDGALPVEYLVGVCYQNLNFATDSTASANALLDADYDNLALTTAGQAEFKGLERVQTVPGLGLAGSGTKGVPSWLVKARQDASGQFFALTILVRL
jgi:hypothetical protein